METKISSFERTLSIFKNAYEQMEQKDSCNQKVAQQTNQLKK